MDYNKNADKIADERCSVSYNQVEDVDNSQPIGLLFTVQQWKDEYGKVDTTEENALISSLITSAQRQCEQYIGVNFSARTVIATLNNGNGGAYLPYGPIGAVTSVTDIDGNVIDPTTGYKLLGSQFKKLLWPLGTVVMTYTGGYVVCPDELINAVKAQVLFLYENRGDSQVGMSPVAAMILNPLRRS